MYFSSENNFLDEINKFYLNWDWGSTKEFKSKKLFIFHVQKNSNILKFLETIVRNDCYCIEYSPMSVESHLHNNNFTLNYLPSAVLFSCNLFIYFNSNPILSTAFMALSYNVFQTVNRLFLQMKDLVLVSRRCSKTCSSWC